MIVLLCPSKGRPEKIKRMWESAKATASNIQLIATVSKEEYNDYYIALKDEYNVLILQEADLMPTVHKWNKSADLAMTQKEAKLFMVTGDDMIFDTQGWDKAILDHYEALNDKIQVYALQDSRDKDGTPHPIMTREYIQAMGYFVQPIFLHWFIDIWTAEIARANGCFTHLREYLLMHDKDNDKGKPDLTHTGIRSYGWAERDKYCNDKMQHVLRSEMLRLGKIMTNKYHDNYLRGLSL